MITCGTLLIRRRKAKATRREPSLNYGVCKTHHRPKTNTTAPVPRRPTPTKVSDPGSRSARALSPADATEHQATEQLFLTRQNTPDIHYRNYRNYRTQTHAEISGVLSIQVAATISSMTRGRRTNSSPSLMPQSCLVQPRFIRPVHKPTTQAMQKNSTRAD